MDNKVIYFDNAATTKVYPEAVEAMKPFSEELYGNPSSVHSFGRQTKGYLDNARKKVAELLGANDKEIYFTSGATEANNWAILGAVDKLKAKGKHIITSAIEHHAVLHVCEKLEKAGYDVTYLPVDEYGIVSMDDVREAIRPDTILITVMYANNEIGTIQPIEAIGALAREKGIVFHTDAVQVVGKLPVDLKTLPVDMLSLSAHKFHGPKGVGALYIKKGVKITNLLEGGGQERNKRPGTENITGIVGLSKALEIATSRMAVEEEKVLALREYLIDEVEKRVPHVRLNGHREKRIAGNANISFSFIEGESMLLALDMYGICGSSGSACTSGSLDPSHVLLGIGLKHETAHGSLRLSLSEFNTKEEIDYFLQVIPSVIERLRSMSPLYEDFLKTKGGN